MSWHCWNIFCGIFFFFRMFPERFRITFCNSFVCLFVFKERQIILKTLCKINVKAISRYLDLWMSVHKCQKFQWRCFVTSYQIETHLTPVGRSPWNALVLTTQLFVPSQRPQNVESSSSRFVGSNFLSTAQSAPSMPIGHFLWSQNTSCHYPDATF